jgi:hypothetical protein
MVVPIQVLQIVEVIFCFWIPYEKDFHEEVGWVGKTWYRPVDHLEVLNRLFRISLEDNIAVAHEDQFVEVEKGFRTWRVDCTQDCFALCACKVI